MANIYFNKEESESAINIIVEFLRNSGYEGSLEAGTGIYDTVIKPSALLYSVFSQLVEKSKAYLSLQQATDQFNAGEMAEDEYDNIVDSILSNWFVTRNDGTPTYGYVRLWFSLPLDFISFSEGDTVGTCNNTVLVARYEQSFAESDFSSILNATQNESEFYIDVAVQSETNTDVVILQDADVDASIADIYYLRASVPSDFALGTTIESSEDFIERTKRAISTRELITDNAIQTTLLEEFPEVYSIYVAGHGDGEQMRDIIYWNDFLIHYGNKADIYLADGLSRQSEIVNVNEDGTLDLSSVSSNVSFCHILECYTFDEDGNKVDDVPFEVKVEETSWCSARYVPESISVTTDAESVYLTWLTDAALNSVQDYVYDDTQRVVCYDPLVKHKFPVVMRFSLDVVLYASDDAAEENIKNALMEYISNLGVSASNYIESEMIAYIHANVPNVQKISVPVFCAAQLFDPLNCAVKSTVISNYFDINTLGETSQQVSDNTVQFYTDSELITVNIG